MSSLRLVFVYVAFVFVGVSYCISPKKYLVQTDSNIDATTKYVVGNISTAKPTATAANANTTTAKPTTTTAKPTTTTAKPTTTTAKPTTTTAKSTTTTAKPTTTTAKPTTTTAKPTTTTAKPTTTTAKPTTTTAKPTTTTAKPTTTTAKPTTTTAKPTTTTAIPTTTTAKPTTTTAKPTTTTTKPTTTTAKPTTTTAKPTTTTTKPTTTTAKPTTTTAKPTTTTNKPTTTTTKPTTTTAKPTTTTAKPTTTTAKPTTTTAKSTTTTAKPTTTTAKPTTTTAKPTTTTAKPTTTTLKPNTTTAKPTTTTAKPTTTTAKPTTTTAKPTTTTAKPTTTTAKPTTTTAKPNTTTSKPTTTTAKPTTTTLKPNTTTAKPTTTTAKPTTTTAKSTTTTAKPSTTVNPESGKLSGGETAGVVIGVLAAFILLDLCLCHFCRIDIIRMRRKQRKRKQVPFNPQSSLSLAGNLNKHPFLKIDGMNEAIKPIDVDLPLPISSLNMKALKVIHHYMENIKNNLCYYHGYIASSEKLKSFLRDYRKATYTVFTVRSSRSYVKKRALNALKSIRDNESVDFNICDDREGGGDIVPPLPDDVTNFNQQNENLMNTMNCGDMPATTTTSMKTRRGRTRKRDDDSLNDVHQGVVGGSGMDDDGNMLTGPLRWEFILGKPPIPFTGVPFFIIGNTQYQCYYATADIRTQRRKEKIAKILKENPTVKARVRRSMKRDCKAVMCIKSIVTFPEFSVVEQIQNIKSKKGARKVKATTLDNLRDVLEKGGNCGHPAFWVHIPLPEAHTTHDIVGTDHKVSDNGNNLDEIAHILELAAQYGNHLDSRHIENAPIPAVPAGHINEGHMAGNSSRQLDMTSEQNATAHHLVPFKLNDPAKELESNQTLALPNDFLCVGNNSTISSSSHIIA